MSQIKISDMTKLALLEADDLFEVAEKVSEGGLYFQESEVQQYSSIRHCASDNRPDDRRNNNRR
jgi:hypothetical protein